MDDDATFPSHPTIHAMLAMLRLWFETGELPPWVNQADAYALHPAALTASNHRVKATASDGSVAWYHLQKLRPLETCSSRSSRTCGGGTWQGDRAKPVVRINGDKVRERIGWQNSLSFKMKGPDGKFKRQGWNMVEVYLDHDKRQVISRIYPSPRIHPEAEAASPAAAAAALPEEEAPAAPEDEAPAAPSKEAPPAPTKASSPPAPSPPAPSKEAPPAPIKAPSPPAPSKEAPPAPIKAPSPPAPSKEAPPAPTKASSPPAPSKEAPPAPSPPAPSKEAPPAPSKEAPAVPAAAAKRKASSPAAASNVNAPAAASTKTIWVLVKVSASPTKRTGDSVLKQVLGAVFPEDEEDEEEAAAAPPRKKRFTEYRGFLALNPVN